MYNKIAKDISFKQKIISLELNIVITRIKKLPESLVEKERESDGQLVVLHSEIGHNLSFDSNVSGVTVLEDPKDSFVTYLNVEETCDLTHKRVYNPHEPFRFTKGYYRIVRQKDWTPEGFKVVYD